MAEFIIYGLIGMGFIAVLAVAGGDTEGDD